MWTASTSLWLLPTTRTAPSRPVRSTLTRFRPSPLPLPPPHPASLSSSYTCTDLDGGEQICPAKLRVKNALKTKTYGCLTSCSAGLWKGKGGNANSPYCCSVSFFFFSHPFLQSSHARRKMELTLGARSNPKGRLRHPRNLPPHRRTLLRYLQSYLSYGLRLRLYVFLPLSRLASLGAEDSPSPSLRARPPEQTMRVRASRPFIPARRRRWRPTLLRSALRPEIEEQVRFSAILLPSPFSLAGSPSFRTSRVNAE